MTDVRARDRDDRPSLLLVDDDVTFCSVLSKALEHRGFQVRVAHTVAGAMSHIQRGAPEYAVIDLKMPDQSGLMLVSKLNALGERTKIVVLTGYASIATAVEAIKLGAAYYLSKPADADDIVAAFHRESGDHSAPVSEKPPSVNRVEWEHINRVLMENHGNISATAKALGMHRRTLQRKLNKHPVRN
ncbi:MAG: response regulator transcription factor [Betaproteobacteria bacterium]|nr:response regulator transcription factor [Betaproteobacteria bacterium]MBI3052590.1 response regulator transcription factor [Betaproteobacteria bacterium]